MLKVRQQVFYKPGTLEVDIGTFPDISGFESTATGSGSTLASSGSTLENIREMLDFGLGDSQKGFFEAGKDLFFQQLVITQTFCQKG